MGRFRFGNVIKLYYDRLEEKQPSQLDLIDIWFPSLVVKEEKPGVLEQDEAVFEQNAFVIHAVRKRGSFYVGSSRQVSQILGRLIGTAKGNQEKERKNASTIQAHLASILVKDFERKSRLQENVLEQLSRLTPEAHEAFYGDLYDYVELLIKERSEAEEYELLNDLFPMDDEVFEGILYNCVYQLSIGTETAIANGYLWLLLGSFLRNHAGRIQRLYDSAFIPVNRQMSDDGTLRDKLLYLLRPDFYESVYEGDDLDCRFPGIEWYCDECGAHLNEQNGFDDHQPEWICTVCGYHNKLSYDDIYDNDEDAANGIHRHDQDDFERAVEERKKQITPIK